MSQWTNKTIEVDGDAVQATAAGCLPLDVSVVSEQIRLSSNNVNTRINSYICRVEAS